MNKLLTLKLYISYLTLMFLIIISSMSSDILVKLLPVFFILLSSEIWITFRNIKYRFHKVFYYIEYIALIILFLASIYDILFDYLAVFPKLVTTVQLVNIYKYYIVILVIIKFLSFLTNFFEKEISIEQAENINKGLLTFAYITTIVILLVQIPYLSFMVLLTLIFYFIMLKRKIYGLSPHLLIIIVLSLLIQNYVAVLLIGIVIKNEREQFKDHSLEKTLELKDELSNIVSDEMMFINNK